MEYLQAPTTTQETFRDVQMVVEGIRVQTTQVFHEAKGRHLPNPGCKLSPRHRQPLFDQDHPTDVVPP